ncbi:MAG: hypothetical protein U9O54_05355 [Chloroflexota bacterium]|nr:hypothetical protein [Chloroflexota bacterium]
MGDKQTTLSDSLPAGGELGLKSGTAPQRLKLAPLVILSPKRVARPQPTIPTPLLQLYPTLPV